MITLRFLTLLLFFIGLSFIVIGYVKSSTNCPSPKVEYRFIPRTFQEEQEAPVKPSVIFADMFNKPTPYIGGFSLENTGSDRNSL